MNNEILISENKVRRHSYFTMFLHWLLVSTVISGLITANIKFSTSKTFHIIGGCIMGLIWVAHLIYHYIIRGGSPIFPRKGDVKASMQLMKATFSGAKEPPNGKYLPEQRLAYIYVLLCIILVFATGLGRVFGGERIHGVAQSLSYVQILGMLHGPAVFLLMLGVIAHLGAFLIKANRPLLIGMFKGKVDLKYVQQRHEIWYLDMQKEIISK